MNIRSIFFALVASAALCTMAGTACAQIFVTHFGNGLSSTGKISVYDATTGAIVNPALISGLTGPSGVAVSGDNLFVANHNLGTIGEYTTSGATVKRTLIAGLADPVDIAVSDGNLFVTNAAFGTIGKYTTSGATVNRSLISGGLLLPTNLALSGENLFVCDGYTDTIGKYTTSGATVDPALITGVAFGGTVAVSGDRVFVGNGTVVQEYTTSGVLVNPALISGVDFFPTDIEVSGGNLFVMSQGFSGTTIGKYTISGRPVNASLISGLGDAAGGFTVVSESTSVPDPSSTLLLLLLGLMTVFSLRCWLRKPA